MRTLAQSICLVACFIALNVIGTPSSLSAPSNSEQLPLDWPATPSRQDENAKAQQLVDRGNAAYKAQDYATAVTMYTELIKLKPSDPRVYYNRGNAYRRLNDLEHALADFSEVLKIDPNVHLALVNRGNIYWQFGKYSEAIADYDRAVKQKPGDPLIWYDRGIAYGRLGNYARAIDDLTEAIRLDPKDARPYVERGLILVTKGMTIEGRRDLELALRVSPENERALRGISKLKELIPTEVAPAEADNSNDLNEMSRGRSVDLLLDLVEEACFKNGEDVAKLKALAENRAWTAATEEERSKSSSATGTLVNGWTNTTGLGSVAILQTLVEENPAAYVCSITTKIPSPQVYRDFTSAI